MGPKSPPHLPSTQLMFPNRNPCGKTLTSQLWTLEHKLEPGGEAQGWLKYRFLPLSKLQKLMWGGGPTWGIRV